VEGRLNTPAGPVPVVGTNLTRSDRWGGFKVRWGFGRSDYKVEPGLYAVGKPGPESPVLVTAGYKLSFDCLRRELTGRDLWILVLDTKGVNVWCSAGKGTFGTEELVSRIRTSGLPGVVSHRVLILPQLAAPGVAAHEVKRLSGFRVKYGPIRAQDLPVFLDRGLKATPRMRLKTFDLWERAVLTPVELVTAFKWLLLALAVFFILSGLGDVDHFFSAALERIWFVAAALLSALLAGALISPLLLPWLPGRAFSLKGMSVGVVAAAILVLSRRGELGVSAARLDLISWFLMIPALSSFLAMNFTGSSTFTSLSGVKKEMKVAVPLQVVSGVAGFGIWVVSVFSVRG